MVTYAQRFSTCWKMYFGPSVYLRMSGCLKRIQLMPNLTLAYVSVYQRISAYEWKYHTQLFRFCHTQQCDRAIRISLSGGLQMCVTCNLFYGNQSMFTLPEDLQSCSGRLHQFALVSMATQHVLQRVYQHGRVRQIYNVRVDTDRVTWPRWRITFNFTL